VSGGVIVTDLSGVGAANVCACVVVSGGVVNCGVDEEFCIVVTTGVDAELCVIVTGRVVGSMFFGEL
jgi:hypothetical protein